MNIVKNAPWSLGLLALLLALVSLSCGEKESDLNCAAPDTSYLSACWQQAAPLGSGGFPGDPGSFDTPVWKPGKFPLTLFPVVAFDGDLWAMSRVSAFSSPDGLDWTRYEKTDWGERIYQDYVFFHDKIWMFGGLSYADRTFLNDIWNSADGVHWEKAGEAAWPPRGGSSVMVYQDRLWLFGGANHVKPDRSTDGFLNDVWVSDDGLQWMQVTAAAPWAPRDDARVVAFQDALYLIGGQGQADVWRSTDGKDWSQLTAEAEWKPRFAYAALALGDNIWVFGGYQGVSTNAVNDVWYSADGSRWLRQAEHAPWAPRMPRSVVFKDKIWIFSGKHTGAADSWGGDIWTMSAAPAGSASGPASGTPTTSPSHVSSGTPGPAALPQAGGRPR